MCVIGCCLFLPVERFGQGAMSGGNTLQRKQRVDCLSPFPSLDVSYIVLGSEADFLSLFRSYIYICIQDGFVTRCDEMRKEMIVMRWLH